MEYYLAIKRNELLIYAITWMDLKMLMLSENNVKWLHAVGFHLHNRLKIAK